MWINGRVIEREKKNINSINMIPICMVYESSHKKQCDKALIRIGKRSKEPELIETEEIDSETNLVSSSIAEFRPNH